MGMYTELHFNAKLHPGVPAEVLGILRYMLAGPDAKLPPVMPEHPLFEAARWRVMLTMDSYYFDADTHSTLRWDETAGSHYLCVRCNVKDYDDEIAKFTDWVMAYLDKGAGDFLGFSRYEKTEQPTLIFVPEAKEGQTDAE